MSCVMSLWGSVFPKAVNNFGLTCVGVRECVGGFGHEFNIGLIKSRGLAGDVLRPACHKLSVFAFTHVELEAGGQHRRPFTRKQQQSGACFGVQTTLTLQRFPLTAK